MKLRKVLVLAVVALLALGLFGVQPVGADSPGPASGNGVVPTLEPDNPSCVDIGYGFGFKINGSPNGTFTLTNPPGELTGGAPSDPNNSVTISNSDGTFFDWSATLGIDAVIVKAGDNADVFVYIPEDTADTDLHGPTKDNGDPRDISHIEFCYDYEVTVSKDANTSFTRTFNWTIDKSVTPETWDLFTGDSGTSTYDVAVTKTGFTDSNWAVNGTITIQNNTPLAANISSIADTISGGINATVNNCSSPVPGTLAAGGTLTCSYSAALPDGTNRINTATVTTSGNIGGGEATADVVFGDPTTVVNGTINVSDTNGGSWQFSDSGSVQYTKTFTCNDDRGQHHNTATIDETGQSDNASVTVNCYELTVTKNANTSLTRTWNWTIDKSADQTDLTLSDGQLFTVNYEVEVNASSTESHAVSGDISVHNPAPIAATINAVSDVVSGVVDPATVDCGVAFPYTLAAGATLNCTYSTDLPDASDRTNTATATLQNYDYDSDGNGTASGTADFSGSADVSFSDTPDQEFDECIDVGDTNVGLLGTVCAGDAPQTFNYSLMFGKHPDADVQLECGDNTHTNTASFVTNDTSATGNDNWTVNANVACQQGCTLTQGYWKTHSEFGPAPYDNTWASLSNGASTPFFLSGQTYYEVLWTAPAGNAYYILAHQYIAAQLNQLNGASIPADVLTAFNQATTLFNTHTPAQIGALKGNNALRKQFIALAETLDKYNNGITGPGHCSE